VLIAQLATANGIRAPLAHVADQVFLELAKELDAQGVSRKVSADMFGLALRTYQRKVQRLNESATERGRSLWEAILEHLNQAGRVVARSEVLKRFHRDDPETVRGVLFDLCESGLVFTLGSGASAAYRVATQDEIGALQGVLDGTGADELVWAIVYRDGPLSREALAAMLRDRDVDATLNRLLAADRIQCSSGSEPLYSAREFHIPRDAEAGWEAAVFDHFQALVKTIAQRVGSRDPLHAQKLGGSTYSFEVWPGHPCEAEALEQLELFRSQASDLRARIRAHNSEHPRPARYLEITVYAGQCAITQEGNP
jgi:hypothetical protein